MLVPRLLQRASHLRSLLLSHHLKTPPLLHSIINNNHYYNTTNIPTLFRYLSTTTTNGNNGKDKSEPESSSWLFEEEEEEVVERGKGLAEELKPWSLDEDDGYSQERERREAVFDLGEVSKGDVASPAAEDDPERKVAVFNEQEEKELLSVLQGPKRVFGDLISASGITDAMLDSLIALKDFEGVDGLPPLREIEDMRYEKSTRKSMGAEIQRQKQEEAAKARVRKVDEKGRAYGTGKRKCSIARVWIQPGEGKFLVNDKDFDAYFPMLDHRAALLQPFCETKTLGLWDVKCTVKGGGVSGQVGAIQLGVSRALQNWEPDLRPPLRKGGYLTRDSRVVERKKPGKAKARKSFQWVKR